MLRTHKHTRQRELGTGKWASSLPVLHLLDGLVEAEAAQRRAVVKRAQGYLKGHVCGMGLASRTYPSFCTILSASGKTERGKCKVGNGWVGGLRGVRAAYT